MDSSSAKPAIFERLKGHKNKIIIAAILVAGVSFWIYQSRASGSTAVRYVTAPVTKGTITSAVSGTGQVAASDQVDLKPQTSGTLTNVAVKQDQQVKAGDIVATVDSQSAVNQVNSAKASLAQAQANYDTVMAGATSNDIATAQLSVKSAQQALDKAKQDYQNTETAQQQAVSKANSTLMNTGLTAQQSDTLTTATVTLSGSYTGQINGQYNVSIYTGAGGLYYSVSGLGMENGQLTRGLDLPLGNGLYINFGTSGDLYPTTSWTIDVPNTKSSSYLTNLNAYNSALETQKEQLQAAQNSINTAQNSLDQANLALQTKQAPPTDAAVASAKAQLQSAEANLQNAETTYSNTIVRVPFDGIIAKVSQQSGDQANPSTAVATEVTKQQIAEITLNEVDAAKVQTGQKATLTFSAVPDLSISGQVAEVDSIGTVTQNVVNFTVKIAFDTQDQRIKPGMSVSAAIITAVKQDVLAVPSSAVKSSAGQSYVQILQNGKPVPVNITTGISSDTQTEVSDGLQEGEQVVTQTISAAAAKTQTSSGSLLPGLGGARTGVGGLGGGGNIRIIPNGGKGGG